VITPLSAPTGRNDNSGESDLAVLKRELQPFAGQTTVDLALRRPGIR
jgi:hypothetical protein